MMMPDDTEKNYYHRQVELLLKILPHVAKENDIFALKGGTAINFFIRDMPRLSVDIDLTYLPIESREITLVRLEESLVRMKQDVMRHHPDIVVREKRTQSEGRLNKLLIVEKDVLIKIEPNEILRGSVFPCELRSLSRRVEDLFGLAITDMPVLSVADLYGGKICAALARQHPRDLFDVKLLLENEGITDSIRQALVVYLASSPRPIHELLNPSPVLQDLRKAYEDGFVGMTQLTVTYEELVSIRMGLTRHLLESFTVNERKFLLSIKSDQSDWKLMPIAGIEKLPALEWKVRNIRKMDSEKHQVALNNLRKLLEI